MAVHQARHMNMNMDMNVNFFREILPPHTNNVNNNNNQQFFSNSKLVLPPAPAMAMNNESFQPLYDLNDVVYQHPHMKSLPPAVQDDSGITFNNNSGLIVPTPPQPSRKRSRGQIPCAAPQLLTMNPLTTACTATTTPGCTSGINNGNKDATRFALFGDDLSLEIMQQQLELDRLVSNHIEKMRLEIEEKKQQQMRRIMAVVEEAVARNLRGKDEDLVKMAKINWALEDKVKSLCLENQIWRDLAQTNEATANALRTNLEQVVQQMNDNAERIAAAEVADDAVSCCGSSGYDDVEEREDEVGDQQGLMKKRRVAVGEDDKNGWIYRGKSRKNCNGNSSGGGSGRLCRKCGEGESTVLLLPCRHLCLCTSCGPTVNSCPICNSVKKASVHVNLS